jgi:hypothetical protein
MKRSFKAATVFAGMSAMTGMFAPAALAAPTHTTAPAKPDIGPWRECGANNGGVSTWVHVYYPHDDHPAECIGGKGETAGYATMASFCPGNNNGSAIATHAFKFYHSSDRNPISLFDHGYPSDQLDGISIWSWIGHAKCT